MDIYVKDRNELAFRECHKNLMKSTPFRAYVDIAGHCSFNIILLEEIISSHIGDNCFKLGPKEVLFSVDDVGIILGLPSSGLRVHHYGSRTKKSRLHDRFGVKTIFDRKKVYSLIQGLVNSEDRTDIEDTVRLWIVLLFCTFVCPRSAHCCPQQMLSYLDDIGRIGEYNWASAVQEITLHNLADVVTVVNNRRVGAISQAKRRCGADSQSYSFIYGCPASLAVSVNGQFDVL